MTITINPIIGLPGSGRLNIAAQAIQRDNTGLIANGLDSMTETIDELPDSVGRVCLVDRRLIDSDFYSSNLRSFYDRDGYDVTRICIANEWQQCIENLTGLSEQWDATTPDDVGETIEWIIDNRDKLEINDRTPYAVPDLDSPEGVSLQ